ncbi:hypothetical protein H4R34_000158 [Dimargaris verticillata]|uniref:Uncharacterized protein n=1 Tax=Dimargaris verticillata TaxID=2761393 RepID=A0A9W8EFN1_9FUNG|nr:hypothetical protein H4R34_000158 [Dimargaris verticillata]
MLAASDTDNLWHALAEAKRSNATFSDSQTLYPVTHDDVLVWYIPPFVEHPLRQQVHQAEFFILTQLPSRNAVTANPTLALQKCQFIAIGEANAAVPLEWPTMQTSTPPTHHYRLCWPDQCLYPLAKDRARYYLSYLSLTPKPPPLSIDLLCDPLPVVALISPPTNASNCSYLGSQIFIDNKGDKSFPSPLVYTLEPCGVCRQNQPSQSGQASEADRYLSIAAIEQRLGEWWIAHNERTTTYDLHYRLLGPGPAPMDSNEPESWAHQSTVTVHANWQAPRHDPAGAAVCLQPPPHSCHVTTTLVSVPGTVDTHTHEALVGLLDELQYLMVWHEIAQDRLAWPDKSTTTSQTTSANSFATRVQSFFQNLAEAQGSTSPAADESDDTDWLFDLPTRKDHDFTEQFWVLCQKAQGAVDLNTAMSGLADGLESGSLKPIVNRANRTALAQVVRDFIKLSQSETLPDYDDQRERLASILEHWIDQPLEVLIEAGIYKLRLDYCFYLIGNNLATHQQLEYFLDSMVSPGEQIARLNQLHRCLEVWHQLRATIHLFPYETMRQVVAKVLVNGRARGQGMLTHVLDASADTSANQSVLGDDEPLVLRVTMPRFSNGTNVMMDSLVASADIYAWSVTMTKGDCNEPMTNPTRYQFTVTRDPRWVAAGQDLQEGNANRTEGDVPEWKNNAGLSPDAYDLSDEDHGSTQPRDCRHTEGNRSDDQPHFPHLTRAGMAPEQYHLVAATTLPAAL